MKLPNKVYDVLKWIVIIVLPALATAYLGIAQIWELPYPDEISQTIIIVDTLLGACLGISTISYNKQINEESEG